MAIAGKVAITPKGEWNANTAYTKLDLVFYENASYVAIQPSTGVTPTNTAYWMLVVQSAGGADLEAIIDGTTQVGNALTLDGHRAEYFAPLSELFSNAKSYEGLDFDLGNETGMYSHPGTPSQVGASNYPVDYTGVLLAFRPNEHQVEQMYITHWGGLYTRGYYAGIGWSEWRQEATTADLANYLPLSAKPTGTYTGNGSATERTVAIGGNGNFLLIKEDSNFITLASYMGAVSFHINAKTTLYLASEQVRYRNGVLTIATDDNSVNYNGSVYTYQVL